MPTQTYHRLWCITCKDWKLFNENFFDQIKKCSDCKTEHKPILLKEIPKEKIIEQRNRYKEYTKKSLDTLLGFGMRGMVINPLDHLFSEDFPTEIIESSAGQKKIDEKIFEKREKEYQQRRLERKKEYEEALKYKGLGRNSICLCGSDKKYKKCCLTKMEKILWR